ncbi:MAG TPA: plastocyanin/azurin family copper-binding protein [Acidimicrobiia bacterium]|nr:plastocyanin/azurin family copper-binding protein [Acidimicrobiia bacterium]
MITLQLRASAAACLVVFAVAVSACGGVEEGKIAGRAGGEPTPDARVIEVEARNFAFDPDTLRAEVGEELAISLYSVDSPHDFAIDGLGRVVAVAGDETRAERMRIDEAGKYDFYCTIPGHRAAGMEGTITVR